jgi:hypothetical protein
MNIDSLSEFIEVAKNSKTVIADFESRLSMLHAMMEIRKEEKAPILNHWIGAAERKLDILKPLYHASLQAQALPLETLIDIHTKLKAIHNG